VLNRWVLEHLPVFLFLIPKEFSPLFNNQKKQVFKENHTIFSKILNSDLKKKQYLDYFLVD